MKIGQMVYCKDVSAVDYYESPGTAAARRLFTNGQAYEIKATNYALDRRTGERIKLIKVTTNEGSQWWGRASAFTARRPKEAKKKKHWAIKTGAGFIEVTRMDPYHVVENDRSRFVKEKTKATLFYSKQDAKYWFDVKFPGQEATFPGIMY